MRWVQHLRCRWLLARCRADRWPATIDQSPGQIMSSVKRWRKSEWPDPRRTRRCALAADRSGAMDLEESHPDRFSSTFLASGFLKSASNFRSEIVTQSSRAARTRKPSSNIGRAIHSGCLRSRPRLPNQDRINPPLLMKTRGRASEPAPIEDPALYPLTNEIDTDRKPGPSVVICTLCLRPFIETDIAPEMAPVMDSLIRLPLTRPRTCPRALKVRSSQRPERRPALLVT